MLSNSRLSFETISKVPWTSGELAEIELETEKLVSAPATPISSYALPHNIFFFSCLVPYGSIYVPHLLKSHPDPIIEKISQENEKKREKN